MVDTQKSGAEAIELLKRKDGGRATFLPLDTIKPYDLKEIPAGEPGYIGVASDLAKCEKQYESILKNLLGRTLVAENLDRAMAIAKSLGNRVRVVTLDGQVVNAGGSLTGGSAARGSGILSRANELERLKETRAKLSRGASRPADRDRPRRRPPLETAETLLDTARAQTEQAQEALHLTSARRRRPSSDDRRRAEPPWRTRTARSTVSAPSRRRTSTASTIPSLR